MTEFMVYWCGIDFDVPDEPGDEPASLPFASTNERSFVRAPEQAHLREPE